MIKNLEEWNEIYSNLAISIKDCKSSYREDMPDVLIKATESHPDFRYWATFQNTFEDGELFAVFEDDMDEWGDWT